MEGYTKKSSSLSRKQVDHLLAVNDSIVVSTAKETSGKVVKNLGDGYLLTFDSPTNAVLCGKKIQEAVDAFNETVSSGERFHLRIAVNSGEVNIKGGDVFGEPVNATARLVAETNPSEITITESVYLAMNRSEIAVVPSGTKILRGIPEAIKVYRVNWGNAVHASSGAAALVDNLSTVIDKTHLGKANVLAGLGIMAAVFFGLAKMTEPPVAMYNAESPAQVMGVSEVLLTPTTTPIPTPIQLQRGKPTPKLTPTINQGATSGSGGNSSRSTSGGGSTSVNNNTVTISPTRIPISIPTQPQTPVIPTPCEFGPNPSGNCRDEFKPTKAPDPIDTPPSDPTPIPPNDGKKEKPEKQNLSTPTSDENEQ